MKKNQNNDRVNNNMLKVYNTLFRKKEILKPRTLRQAQGKKKINLFICGPTVYDFSHIGHARTYIAFDVIVKYLKQKGYGVFYLQNITDIDDKIIKRAKEKKITPRTLARRFEKEYLKDMESLGIDSVTEYARATDYIKEIISQAKRLLEKGYAYEIEDGLYYDISKFKEYGKLSKRTALQAQDAVSRIDDSKEKRNKGDFCLWKFSQKGEPTWPFEKLKIKKGRPGWHIEDTAITEKFFGAQYDIHGGARDLIFPHHEAEISQMEAISNKKPLVKYWLHTGFLTVGGQKMSKSLGNFITIRDFLQKHSPRILRLLILKSHYRSPIDYNEKTILQTKKEIERIDELVVKLKQITKNKKQITATVKKLISKNEKDFEKVMDDDFNTPKAVALIFSLISKANKLIDQNKLTKKAAKEILNFLKKIDQVFGFIFDEEPEISSRTIKLAKNRKEYREKGQWEKADEMRKEIEKEKGCWIVDTKKGSILMKNIGGGTATIEIE
ncbi:cysteine--tRNA ligase [Patescibacteria group bacterium]